MNFENWAPFIGEVLMLNKFSSGEEILQYANGPNINAKKREGIVFKSMGLINDKIISFKVISNQFLLNEKEDVL